ncbi:hypothetical protein LP419_08460 [Massilia sp. H-1]|nr:hypothetical protein LP419_08460 [Massilia sp. H-1]
MFPTTARAAADPFFLSLPMPTGARPSRPWRLGAESMAHSHTLYVA